MSDFFGRVAGWGPLKVLGTRIGKKTVVGTLLVALVPLIVLGVMLQRRTSDSLMQKSYQQLESVRVLKTSQINGYFNDLQDKLRTFAENEMTVSAMQELGGAFGKVREENSLTDASVAGFRAQLRDYYTNGFEAEFSKRNDGAASTMPNNLSVLDEDSIALQYYYIQNNVNPLGSKDQLDASSDNSSYSKLHARFHPTFRSYLKKFGLYDIFLIDPATGDVIYTCYKELDFTTSLKNGPYANTGLGEAYRKALQAAQPGTAVMTDFAAYLPSYNDPAGFLAAPIHQDGQLIGIACFQFPIDRLNAIMEERTGLGESGETYLVGKDSLFRSQSRFTKEMGVRSAILNEKVKVETQAAVSANRGESGTAIISDYRNSPVLSSWGPIKVHTSPLGVESDLNWAIMSEIDLAEVQAPLNQAFQFALYLTAGSAVVVILFSLLFARGITRQAEEISRMLSMIGIGMFDARANVVSKDELGDVAYAINAMCDNTLTLIQSREERDQIQTSIQKLQDEVRELASGNLANEVEVTADITGPVAQSVNDMITQLRGIVSNIQKVTVEVSSAAAQIRATTEHLSTGSEAQSTQISQTSEAVTEMAASIQTVAENTRQSSEVAAKARQNAVRGTQVVQEMISGMERIRDQVQDSSKRIKRLGEASQEIGEIVQLISDIADRTSILALNASIQAAMAGEAGQGFAVVAEEVDRLAERSNEATKRIGTLIHGVQSETAEAIAAMERSTREVVDGSKLATQAGSALGEIDSVSNELAALIAEVTQATRQQARGAEAISKAMVEISSVTHQTAAGTKQAAESVTMLAQMADDLNFSVSAFKLPAVSA